MSNIPEANKLLDVIKFYLGDREIYPVVDKNGVIIMYLRLSTDLYVEQPLKNVKTRNSNRLTTQYYIFRK
jgi:hypothetical protein